MPRLGMANLFLFCIYYGINDHSTSTHRKSQASFLLGGSLQVFCCTALPSVEMIVHTQQLKETV